MMPNWFFDHLQFFFVRTIFWSGAKQRFCFRESMSVLEQNGRIQALGFLARWRLTSHALFYKIPYFISNLKKSACASKWDLLQLVTLWYIVQVQLKLRTYLENLNFKKLGCPQWYQTYFEVSFEFSYFLDFTKFMESMSIQKFCELTVVSNFQFEFSKA